VNRLKFLEQNELFFLNKRAFFKKRSFFMLFSNFYALDVFIPAYMQLSNSSMQVGSNWIYGRLQLAYTDDTSLTILNMEGGHTKDEVNHS
jgi:hypothetical protein